jgi:hypothetical protein
VKLKIYLLSFLFISGLAFAACGGTSGAASSSPSNPLTAQDIVDKATKSDLKSAEYTVEVKLTIGGQESSGTGKGKFTKSPPRTAIDLTVVVSGISVTTSLVADDKYTYTKNPTNGTWSKTPLSSTDSDIASYDLNSPTLVGKETVNGIETYHVKGTNKQGIEREFWFRTDNFYPLKGTIIPTAQLPMTGNIIYTKWNDPSTSIEIPTVS